MSNPVHIQFFLDGLVPTFLAVDEYLKEWTGEGCLQFPILMGTITVTMGWDNEKVRRNDPIIREYLRSHPDWCITRGAHGGIMRRSEKDKKEAAKLAKESAVKLAKEAVKAEIEARLEADAAKKAAANLASASAPAEEIDNTNNMSE